MRRYGTVLTVPLGWLLGAVAAAAPAPSAVDVPLRFVDKSPPLVTVRIQGRDIPLWIDLGAATPLILHPALLARLATTPTGRSFSSFGMEGRVDTVPVVTLARATLGGRRFTDLSAIPDSHDAEYLEKQMPPGQGSLGAGFFAGYAVSFDYPRRRLTLVPADAPAAVTQHVCRGQDIPLVQDRASDWGLVTRVQTDTGALLFVWDTGTPGLVMPKSSAQAAGLEASGATVTLPRARMNGHEFGPLRFEIWDAPVPAGLAGFIGYDFFAAHRVCVDFPNHRLLVR